ncbi:bifunctional 3-oxoadipate enol-lactonase/4-carboxymuconolactone decarboxylase PcaDC [Georgenia subflava]|uniref:4-carboxymuconolactone decarboxylase n=1 Tax=Georgenia subflava TaxID=1622177 RepID=A0A6N7EHN1_9MICO|nr:4-carboxymuconolactone decarboxylase [Georgenia subflava]MPV37639.1 4-carboxymuconolactone decarboxylase [Georgenia subflava]
MLSDHLPAYEASGPDGAPVVVLGSSLGTDRHTWDEQVRLLERRYRVVRYELPGHGGSATRAPGATIPVEPATTGAGGRTIADLGSGVLRLMDHLGVPAAHHVGLSVGGMVATWLAVHHPERVNRLALVCSSAHLPPAEKWLTRAAIVREQGMGAIWESVVAGWFTPAWHDPQRLARIRETFLAVEPEGYAQCCEAIASTDLRPGLGDITAPVLAVAGAEDRSTPPEMSEELVAAVRAAGGDARLEVVDGAAHLSAVQQSATVTALLLEHLDADRAGHAAGMRVRREVLGDAHVDRAQLGTTTLTVDFQDFITRYAWGDVWARPGLDRRTRSAITLALLAALGHDGEFAMHVRAALRNGLTVDEIREVLLHLGVYAGIPVSNHAYGIAQRVLTEEGLG